MGPAVWEAGRWCSELWKRGCWAGFEGKRGPASTSLRSNPTSDPAEPLSRHRGFPASALCELPRHSAGLRAQHARTSEFVGSGDGFPPRKISYHKRAWSQDVGLPAFQKKVKGNQLLLGSPYFWSHPLVGYASGAI